MSIKIEAGKCTGCGKCLNVCPGSLIYRDDKNRAYIRYPRDCWGCTACLKECSAGAIRYFLGADIGGKGAYLHTRHEKDLLHWYITRADGEREAITINKKESNKY